MRLLFEHALPRKIDYARFYVDLGVASMHFLLKDKTVSWSGRIGKATSRDSTVLSDQEYFRHRLQHTVEKIFDEDSSRVIVSTTDGAEEEWLKPRWILRRLRLRS